MMNFYNALYQHWIASKSWSDLPTNLFDYLIEKYCENHRKYHNLQHLVECFEEFDYVQDKLQNKKNVYYAIWFHDAIYHPECKDNEEQSADFMMHKPSPLSNDQREQITKLILATKDHLPFDNDSRYLVDIDMSILGKPPTRFREYNEEIRQEYSVYPDEIYYPEREKILRTFLKRQPLFRTPEFRIKYEAQAKRNLIDAIQQIQYRT